MVQKPAFPNKVAPVSNKPTWPRARENTQSEFEKKKAGRVLRTQEAAVGCNGKAPKFRSAKGL